jgi:HAD superfamily hydrolase (TIGR01509 family)
MVANLPYHREAWMEYGRRHALPITADYYRDRIHSRANVQIVEHLAEDFGWTPPGRETAGDEKEAIYRDLYRPHLCEVPGVTRLIKELNARQIPCAAVSNSPRPNVDMVLGGLGLAQCFQVALTADGMKRGKPDPYAFLAAASQLGVPIWRCIVFEDSVSGFQAAERAGAPYIAVSAGAEPSALKHAGRALRIIDDFMEISTDMLAAFACGTHTPVQ